MENSFKSSPQPDGNNQNNKKLVGNDGTDQSNKQFDPSNFKRISKLELYSLIVIPVIAIVASVLISVNEQRNIAAREIDHEVRQDSIAFRHDFIKLKTSTYIKLSKHIGMITHYADNSLKHLKYIKGESKILSEKYLNAKDSFNEIYWGELILIEDSTSVKAIQNFRGHMELYELDIIDQDDLKHVGTETIQALKSANLILWTQTN